MVVTDSVLALRRSARVFQPLDRYGFLALTSQSSNDPRIYGETMLDIDSDKWLEAMRSEIDSMLSNQMDVKMAFLDGFIEEEIYMDQPEGFTSVKEEQKGLPRYYVVVRRAGGEGRGEMGGGTLEGRNSDEGKAHGGRRSNTVGRKHFDGGGGTSVGLVCGGGGWESDPMGGAGAACQH
ncbi:hypothetical protein Sango_2117600 [Sesamum angolense]|uniref:Retrotransposon protein n=1 Tax=Sesamum angolense TaxID=2727404 RepID=A0AAE2BM88_9LAMI|nr:hypothetical protein Sango_2117600 [Sesamum angolense]